MHKQKIKSTIKIYTKKIATDTKLKIITSIKYIQMKTQKQKNNNHKQTVLSEQTARNVTKLNKTTNLNSINSKIHSNIKQT